MDIEKHTFVGASFKTFKELTYDMFNGLEGKIHSLDEKIDILIDQEAERTKKAMATAKMWAIITALGVMSVFTGLVGTAFAVASKIGG